MTHNIIHDDSKVEELVENVAKICDSVEFLRGVPVALPSEVKALLRGNTRKALKQYAEHTLVKFIDEQVEMTDEREKATRSKFNEMFESIIADEDNCEFNVAYFKEDNIDKCMKIAKWYARQSLKAQLTKSKPVDNSKEKDNK